MAMIPKNRTEYENKIADAVVTHTKMKDRQMAWQGVHQVGDRYQKRINAGTPMSWSANSLAEGAFCRDGAAAITIDAKDELEPLFDACEVIDAECLQRV